MVWSSGQEFARLFTQGVGRERPGEPAPAAWTWKAFARAYREARDQVQVRTGEACPSYPADEDTPGRWYSGEARIQRRFRSAILAVFFGVDGLQSPSSGALRLAWEEDDRSKAARPNPEASPGPALTEAERQFTSLDSGWVGRQTRLQRLTRLVDEGCRLLVIVGMPGIGKTALGERLAQDLIAAPTVARPYTKENLDDRSAAHSFAAVALRWLDAWGDPASEAETADVQQLTAHVVRHLSATPRLVQIDSLEMTLAAETVEGGATFADRAWADFIVAFLKMRDCPSRIVATSQVEPAELDALGTRVQTVWAVERLEGLTSDEQRALFERAGCAPAGDAAADRLRRIGAAYQGHPLALRVIAGEVLNAPFNGDLEAYWRAYGAEIEAVESALLAADAGDGQGEDRWRLDSFTRKLRQHVRGRLDEAFRRLRDETDAAYVMLCEAAIYRSAVPETFWVAQLADAGVSAPLQQAALGAVKDRYLVDLVLVNEQPGLKLHNLVRSVALDHLRRLGEAA